MSNIFSQFLPRRTDYAKMSDDELIAKRELMLDELEKDKRPEYCLLLHELLELERELTIRET